MMSKSKNLFYYNLWFNIFYLFYFLGLPAIFSYNLEYAYLLALSALLGFIIKIFVLKYYIKGTTKILSGNKGLYDVLAFIIFISIIFRYHYAHIQFFGYSYTLIYYLLFIIGYFFGVKENFQQED